MSARSLPDYKNPPAQETWMAFTFAPLKWDIPHFGAFWAEVKDEYPTFEVHPPIGEFALEVRGGQGPEVSLNLPVRCWFMNKGSNRLIQVQNSKFFHNWRRPTPDAEYLHYDELRPHFEREWDRFCDFNRRLNLGEALVLSTEVCYVNHLEREKGWANFSDLSLIFPTVGSFAGRAFLPKPQMASLNAAFGMGENDGRLGVSVQPVIRQLDGKEIIQFSLTGTCRPATTERKDLVRCLDLCREWVVRGFDDFTSEQMHKLWEKK